METGVEIPTVPTSRLLVLAASESFSAYPLQYPSIYCIFHHWRPSFPAVSVLLFLSFSPSLSLSFSLLLWLCFTLSVSVSLAVYPPQTFFYLALPLSLSLSLFCRCLLPSSSSTPNPFLWLFLIFHWICTVPCFWDFPFRLSLPCACFYVQLTYHQVLSGSCTLSSRRQNPNFF